MTYLRIIYPLDTTIMSRIFRSMFLSEKPFLFSVPKVEFEPGDLPVFKELSNPWDHQIIVMDRKKVLLESNGDDRGIPRDLGKLHTVIKQQGVNSMKLPGPVNVYKQRWKITMRLMGKSTISTGPFSMFFCMLTRPDTCKFQHQKPTFRCFFGDFAASPWHASMITFNVSLRQCGRKAFRRIIRISQQTWRFTQVYMGKSLN